MTLRILLTLIFVLFAAACVLAYDSEIALPEANNFSRPAFSATPTPTPCPKVSIRGPAQVAAGEIGTFRVSIPKGMGDTVAWSVEGGRLIGIEGDQARVASGNPGETVRVSVEAQSSCRVSDSLVFTVVDTLPEPDFGSLEGIVKDLSGHPLNGAMVIVSLPNGGSAKETTSNGGKYEFNRIIVGEHPCEATMGGFEADKESITIRKNKSARKDFALKAHKN
jgi:hypothetical protein